MSLAEQSAVDNTKMGAERYPSDYELQDAAARGLYKQKTYDAYYKVCLQQKGL